MTNMVDLLIPLIERLAILVMIAFILTRFPFFRDMIYSNKLTKKQQIFAILFFGAFAIISTYTGISLNLDSLHIDTGISTLTEDEAIANSRVVGILIAGLLGGYRVGIGVGLIAGIHRFMLGGFTAFSCGLSAIISGVLAGMFYKKNNHVTGKKAFFIGVLAESIQMIIILIISKPFDRALALVEIIGLPMILANGFGTALFLLIIKSVMSEEEKTGALQAQKTLRITEKTLPYLRNGLTIETANKVCDIIHKEINTSAVSITNATSILAHIGLGDDHHKAEREIQTQVTLDTIRNGEVVVANQERIQCRVEGCPLGAVVIAPLKQRGKTVGTLKFYFRSVKEITPIIVELITGLSSILSTQLEIAEADKAYQLANEAEIKALQAQISPHFLFNSLNTIQSLVRLDPKKARKVLQSLSDFLRQNLTSTKERLTTIEQELKHVQSYLTIEEIRFKDKLKVTYDIADETLFQHIPPLTLQPIVENAVKHGMKDKETPFFIFVSIFQEDDKIHILVKDNGSGMTKERAKIVTTNHLDSKIGNGVALYNINRRLMMLFGEDAALEIQSELNEGTEISFKIPYEEGKSYAVAY